MNNIKIWRKYGSIPILLAQIFTSMYCNNIIQGFVIALWLTVPCGIMYINRNWWLWYPRQLLFASFAILSIIK